MLRCLPNPILAAMVHTLTATARRLPALLVLCAGCHRAGDEPAAAPPEPSYRVERIIGGEADPIEGLDTPMGIAVDSRSRIWIADPATSRVLLIDTQSRSLTHLEGGSGDGALERPVDVWVAPAGDEAWVADFLGNRVAHLDGNGQLLNWIGGPESLASPSSVCVTESGDLLVAAYHGARVHRFAGSLHSFFGARGSTSGRFIHPTAVVPYGDGLAIVDRDNHRLQFTDLFGEPRGALSEAAGIPLSSPSDVAVAGTVLHVADSGNHRVVSVDGSGATLAVWSNSDCPDQETVSPIGIAASDDLVYVSDPACARVVVLRLVIP